MGNYMFTTEALIEAVTADAEADVLEPRHGRQHRPDAGRAAARRTSTTSRATRCRERRERDRGYWRDVGTLDAFYDAHMDLISVHPVFNLYNQEWPILTWPEPLPPAKFVFEDDDRIGHALDSMVCAGVVISGATVRRSVLSPGVHVHSYAEVEGSILMPGVDVARHAVVRNAILDKNVRVLEGAQIGVDPEADRKRFAVSAGGVDGGRQGRGGRAVRVALLTREYPPEVYGGAGVHVEYLARELARLDELTVHCWGADRDGAVGPSRVGRAGRRRSAPGRAARDVDRPVDGRRRRGRRARPLAHLVREPRRAPGQADLRHPARGHGPLAGAAAPVEGRAARRRLRAVARSASAPRWRRADAVIAVSEGMRRDVLAAYPARRPRARARDLQRHRRRRVRARPGHRRARAPRRRPGRAVGGVRRADHAPEGRAVPGRGGPGAGSGRAARAVRGRARHAGDRRAGARAASSACGPSAAT